MREYGSQVGVCNDCLDISIESNPFTPEDAHAAILSGLADEPAYDIIQLDPHNDPDLVGLVIGGRLRATYRKVDVYTSTSMVAQTLLDRASAQAFRANTLVRNFNRATTGSVDGSAKRGTRSILDRLESESGAWEETAVEGKEAVTLLDDDILSDTLPGFFDDVTGLASNRTLSSDDEW